MLESFYCESDTVRRREIEAGVSEASKRVPILPLALWEARK